MFPCIICLSCGNDIGSIYALFSTLKKRQIAQKYGNVEDPAMVQALGDLNIELGSVLDDLGVKRVCCRTKLLTQKLFQEYY
jgi:DNA-directed RNA polymerase subunit N (RpoN/RPB10)